MTLVNKWVLVKEQKSELGSSHVPAPATICSDYFLCSGTICVPSILINNSLLSNLFSVYTSKSNGICVYLMNSLNFVVHFEQVTIHDNTSFYA